MGRSPCCDKMGLKKGPWTPEEDQMLLSYIDEYGYGNWRALPVKAGLQRCGKSCRLRWTNYLRPDIKRGKFTIQEEQTIIQLHALLGNRWSAIATHLPKRTDNEIKNYWNTHLKKRLAKMGIDPVTHKPKNDALVPTGMQQTKNAATLNHMAQWETARLEAEARLVRQSKLRSGSGHSSLSTHHLPTNFENSHSNSNSNSNSSNTNISTMPTTSWHSIWPSNISITTSGGRGGSHGGGGARLGIESQSSTKEEGMHQASPNQNHYQNGQDNQFSASSSGLNELIEANNKNDNMSNVDEDYIDDEEDDGDGDDDSNNQQSFMEGFTELLLGAASTDANANACGDKGEDEVQEGGTETDNSNNDRSNGSGIGSDYYEDNKYWNTILNLVNSSPTHSPMF